MMRKSLTEIKTYEVRFDCVGLLLVAVVVIDVFDKGRKKKKFNDSRPCHFAWKWPR